MSLRSIYKESCSEVHRHSICRYISSLEENPREIHDLKIAAYLVLGEWQEQTALHNIFRFIREKVMKKAECRMRENVSTLRHNMGGHE